MLPYLWVLAVETTTVAAVIAAQAAGATAAECVPLVITAPVGSALVLAIVALYRQNQVHSRREERRGDDLFRILQEGGYDADRFLHDAERAPYTPSLRTYRRLPSRDGLRDSRTGEERRAVGAWGEDDAE